VELAKEVHVAGVRHSRSDSDLAAV
jgi:hypothetical protein